MLIGCDYHPSVQQIAWANTETGECGERRLTHCTEAEQFYRDLKQKGFRVRVAESSTRTRTTVRAILPGEVTSHHGAAQQGPPTAKCTGSHNRVRLITSAVIPITTMTSTATVVACIARQYQTGAEAELQLCELPALRWCWFSQQA